MNHSDISLLVIQQNCSILATFIEASHYVYICRYSITTVGLRTPALSRRTFKEQQTTFIIKIYFHSIQKKIWNLKDYTAIENKWKRIISILIWKTFFLLIWWVVLSLLSLPFESLPLSHYLCEDSISFTCAYGAPVVVGFFFT